MHAPQSDSPLKTLLLQKRVGVGVAFLLGGICLGLMLNPWITDPNGQWDWQALLPQLSDKPAESYQVLDQQIAQLANRAKLESQYVVSNLSTQLSEEEKAGMKAYFESLVVIDTIQNRVSPLHFGAWASEQLAKKGEVPPMTEEAFIEAERGICGDQVRMAALALHRLGHPVKALDLYHMNEQDEGHIALEVWFNHQWNFMDVTYGTMFQSLPPHQPYELLSLHQVQALFKEPSAAHTSFLPNQVTNQMTPFYQAVLAFQKNRPPQTAHITATPKNPMAFLGSPRLDVLTNGDGAIRLWPVNTLSAQMSTQQTFEPQNTPTFLGHYHYTLDKRLPGHWANLSWRLQTDSQTIKAVTLDVKAPYCEKGGQLQLHYGKTHQSLNSEDLKPGIVKVPLKQHSDRPSELTLQIHSTEAHSPCYIELRSIKTLS